MRFTKVFRTQLGHKCILVECSVIALCLTVVSNLSRYKPVCYINRTMICMSIKRISVLNLYHVLKPFVKSTPGVDFTKGCKTWHKFSTEIRFMLIPIIVLFIAHEFITGKLPRFKTFREIHHRGGFHERL